MKTTTATTTNMAEDITTQHVRDLIRSSIGAQTAGPIELYVVPDTWYDTTRRVDVVRTIRVLLCRSVRNDSWITL